jgi:Sigma-70, region 4
LNARTGVIDLLLREVFEFSNAEAAQMLGISEPALRHKLSSARQQMTEHFDGLCQVINKTGRCYQCVTLRDFAPERFRTELITRIEPSGSSHVSLSEALSIIGGKDRDCESRES